MYIQNKDFIYLWITPILGLTRDLSKKKPFVFLKFIRTPFIIMLTSMYYRIRKREHLFQVLIFERWLMLFYKTCYSIAFGKQKKLKDNKK